MTNYSVYFDGTGDRLSVPYNTAFDFGSGDFTIECFFYIAANANQGYNSERGFALVSTEKNSTPFDNSPGYFLYVAGDTVTTGTGLSFVIRAGANPTVISYTGTIAQSVWHHVAVTRFGSTVGIYFNGVLVASNTSFSGTVAPASSMEFKIGYRGTVASFLAELNGYISNLRVVKGTALYTANFTPATSALSSAGATLLTCASNRFRDLSANNFAITRNGDARVTDFNPFGTQVANPPSMYFDGTGDYVKSILNANLHDVGSAFTFEMWVYPNVITNGTNYIIIASQSGGVQDWNTTNGLYWNLGLYQSNYKWQWNNAGATFEISAAATQYAWAHIAITYNHANTTTTFYVNGVSQATSTSPYSTVTTRNIFTVGAGPAGASTFTGYVSDLKFTRGSILYGGFEPPTQPLPVR